MRNRILQMVLIVFSAQSVFGQQIESYFKDQQSAPFQKLYLHTDREFYFKGDTLWFASYLVDEKTHAPLSENCNLYVDLVNSNKQPVIEEMFAFENGFCHGWISFSDTTLSEGNYLIRAYTDYLRNFGEDLFFTKTIKVSEIKNSNELLETANEIDELPKIAIEFFPEGGFILKNKINKIAFKATDKTGKGIDIKGRIIYNKGKTEYAFKTDYQGMGVFYIRPENNFSYKIEIEDYPNLNLKLPAIKEDGAKLMLLDSKKNNYRLQILTNNTVESTSYYIAGMHRGEGTFYLEVENKNIQNPVWIKSNLLKEGINQLILLDENFRPLAERMLFKNSENIIQLKLIPNKDEFATRENISIEIEANSNLRKREFTQLSMVVLDENALNSNGFAQNIKSYLLIDSELKGFIETPADFFRDDETITSPKKLELLMLTQGWKNYIWQDFKNDDIEFKFQPQLGISVSGKVYNNGYKKKTLDNSTVTMGIFNSSLPEIYTTNSNSKGDFSFSGIQVTDSTKIFFQGRNSKDKLRTYLEINPVEFIVPEVSDKAMFQINHFKDIPLSQYRSRYLNELDLKAFYPEKNSRLIEEVTIKEKLPEKDDGHYRLYTVKPNQSLKVDHAHADGMNIFQYIDGRFPGLDVQYNGYEGRVKTQGSTYEILYLLDGFPVDSHAIATIPMVEVDKIEFLRGPQVIFGAAGAGGVLSVFTNKIEFGVTEAKKIPGTLVKKIKGFAPYREFYSPKYTAKNISTEAPDYRTTLYWNPQINLQNGKAEVSFFTCDNITRYKVFIEGITETGKICLGKMEFEVNKKTE